MQAPLPLLLAALLCFPTPQAPSPSLADPAPTRPTLRRATSVTNLGVALRFFQPFAFGDPGAMIGDRFVALHVEESEQGATDLNGDGDTRDTVLHVYDRRAASLLNTMLAVDPDLVTFVAAGTVAALVREDGVDLNGDGDSDDRVLHLIDARTGAANNLGLTATAFFETPSQNRVRQRAGTLAVELSEDGDEDLNGDGDRTDVVIALGLLGTRSSLRPRTPGVARLAATPLLATGDLPSRDGTQMVLDRDLLVMGVDELYQNGWDLNGDGDAIDFGVLHAFDARTGAVRNLGISGNFLGLGEGFLAFRSPEDSGGQDLNGDGDLADEVLHCFDPATGTIANLGLAVTSVWANGSAAAGRVSEAGQGLDLNGDGDLLDTVPFVHVHDTATTTLLPLGAALARPVGARVVLLASEIQEGTDLNGDGDALDDVLHTHPIDGGTTRNEDLVVSSATIDFGLRFAAARVSEDQNAIDLNGDGDLLDSVHVVYDGVSDVLTNTGVAGWNLQSHRESGPYVALAVQEFGDGVDYNNDGDSSDTVILVHDATSGTLVNPGLAIFPLGALGDIGLQGNGLLVLVPEVSQGNTDLNGDGDVADARAAFLVTLP